GWITKALSKLKKGNRHSTLLKIAGRLIKDKCTESEIIALLAPHAKGCDFPQEELEKLVRSVYEQYSSGGGARQGKAEKIVALLEEDLMVFHDQREDAYAAISKGPKPRVIKIRSAQFRKLISKLVWNKLGETTSRATLDDVTSVLEGKANDGALFNLELRVAWHDEAIYYDLGHGRAVKVTAEGWDVVQAPILFRQHGHQKQQVVPIKGGDLKQLLRFVNLPQEDGNNVGLLFLAWVVTSLIPGFPHPVLVAHGSGGSAKSTLFRVIKELLDPSSVRTLAPTERHDEFVLQAEMHWFLPIDNLSHLSGWMSDAISRACTGEGSQKRQLFTDSDVVIYSFQRVIGLNGVNLVVDKPDLLDRSLLLALERVPDHKRMEETEFWRQFDEAKPAILGGLFDVLSQAIKRHPAVSMKALPRMADFTRWGVAVTESLGHEAEDFLHAYKQVIATQNREAIQASPVALAIEMLMKTRTEGWTGTASNLLDELNAVASELHIDIRSKAWPKDPSRLGRRIKVVQTNLEDAGIIIRWEKNKQRIITIKTNDSAVSTVATDIGSEAP
ncbi:MAG: primase C-terminal domain-containing protein, partial [Candidatus Omnitrophota bacterium]